jgi:hypothetical protein
MDGIRLDIHLNALRRAAAAIPRRCYISNGSKAQAKADTNVTAAPTAARL